MLGGIVLNAVLRKATSCFLCGSCLGVFDALGIGGIVGNLLGELILISLLLTRIEFIAAELSNGIIFRYCDLLGSSLLPCVAEVPRTVSLFFTRESTGTRFVPIFTHKCEHESEALSTPVSIFKGLCNTDFCLTVCLAILELDNTSLTGIVVKRIDPFTGCGIIDDIAVDNNGRSLIVPACYNLNFVLGCIVNDIALRFAPIRQCRNSRAWDNFFHFIEVRPWLIEVEIAEVDHAVRLNGRRHRSVPLSLARHGGTIKRR